MITILNNKSDEIGVLSSTLCMLHCFATPILLVAIPSTSVIHPGNLGWWSSLELLFLGFSFVAIYSTVQRSTLRWLRISLIISGLSLCFFIFSERFELIEFSEVLVYMPAFALIALHLINIRLCRCQAKCCECPPPPVKTD